MVVPSPKTGKKPPSVRPCQHKASDVCETAADPIAESSIEADIAPETSLGVGEDAGSRSGLRRDNVDKYVMRGA